MCQALLDSIAATNRVGLETWLVNEWGKPFASSTAFGNKFREWVREAGLPTSDHARGIKGCSPHGIRKAAACSRRRERRYRLRPAMAMFGWLTEKEFTRYAHGSQPPKVGKGWRGADGEILAPTIQQIIRYRPGPKSERGWPRVALQKCPTRFCSCVQPFLSD